MPIRAPWPRWAGSAPNAVTGKGDGDHPLRRCPGGCRTCQPSQGAKQRRLRRRSWGQTAVPRADQEGQRRPWGAFTELAHVDLVSLSQAVGAPCVEPNPTRGLLPEAPLLGLCSEHTLDGANCHVQICWKCLTSAALVNRCDGCCRSYRWGPAHIRSLPNPCPGAASCLWRGIALAPGSLICTAPLCDFSSRKWGLPVLKGFSEPRESVASRLGLSAWATRSLSTPMCPHHTPAAWARRAGGQVWSCPAHSTADARVEEPLFSQGNMPSRSQGPVPGSSWDLRLGAV